MVTFMNAYWLKLLIEQLLNTSRSMWLNVKFESPSSEILPKLAFNICTRFIFSGNLGMYDNKEDI
jgi:hypothetical protein